MKNLIIYFFAIMTPVVVSAQSMEEINNWFNNDLRYICRNIVVSDIKNCKLTVVQYSHIDLDSYTEDPDLPVFTLSKTPLNKVNISNIGINKHGVRLINDREDRASEIYFANKELDIIPIEKVNRFRKVKELRDIRAFCNKDYNNKYLKTAHRNKEDCAKWWKSHWEMMFYKQPTKQSYTDIGCSGDGKFRLRNAIVAAAEQCNARKSLF